MSKTKASKKAAKKAAPVIAGADAFRMDLRIHIAAAVGVTFVRTTEPFEAQRAIEDMCITDNLPLRMWNILRGWHSYDVADENLPVTEIDENNADPIPALTKLYDRVVEKPKQAKNTALETQFPADAVCVMMWPDTYIKNIPQMRALVAELAKELQVNTQALFLIVPPTFSVPDELCELVPIVDFGLPTQEELLNIYNTVRERDITDPQRDRTKEFNHDDALAICNAGAGMTRGEFGTALCAAYVSMEKRDLRGAETFRKEVMDRKVSLVKRSEVLEVLSPVALENVGGLGDYKDWIAKRRVCFTPEAAEAGVDIPRGVAAIGPPGTGKSLVAKATGAALGMPVIRFDVSRVFGSLVGESEARMAKALAMIDAMAPCVAFVDEVDKVFNVNSGGGDSGTSTRVMGKILTHMQESKRPIFWMLTANRVDNLPPEMLRKGRLSEIFSVTTPTEDERKEILAIHLRQRGEDPEDFDLDTVAAGCNGYVGGEIEAAVIDAKVEAFNADRPLRDQDIIDAFTNMKPLSMSFADQFAAMEDWAEKHARPASSVKAKRARAPASQARSRNRSVGRVRGGASGGDDEMAG